MRPGMSATPVHRRSAKTRAPGDPAAPTKQWESAPSGAKGQRVRKARKTELASFARTSIACQVPIALLQVALFYGPGSNCLLLEDMPKHTVFTGTLTSIS